MGYNDNYDDSKYQEYSPINKDDIQTARNVKKTVDDIRSLKDKISSAKNVGEAVGKEVGKGAAKQAASSAAKKVGEEAAKTAVSTAVKGATGAVAGAATGGISTAVMMAVASLKKIKDTTDQAKVDITGSETGNNLALKIAIGSFVSFLLLIILIFFTPLLLIALALHWLFTNAVNVVQEWGYNIAATFDSQARERDQLLTELFNKYDIEYKWKHEAVSSQQTINETSMNIFKDIIDASIDKTVNETIHNFLKGEINSLAQSLFKFGAMEKYDIAKTVALYFNLKYPYTLAHEDGSYYTILDYMQGKIPADELNNDVNYAEIIAVYIGLNNESDKLYKTSYGAFFDVLYKARKDSLFCEFNLEGPYCLDENGNEKFDKFGERVVYDSKKTPKANYYMKPTIVPYGLKELYAAYGSNIAAYDEKLNQPHYKLIDYYEDSLRAQLQNVSWGPGYKDSRDKRSSYYPYYDYVEFFPTGRSPISLLPASVNDYMIAAIFSPEWLMENELWEDRDYIINDGESVILKMKYINQLDYPNDLRGAGPDTISKSGCCDCSYVMCAQYYLNTDISIRAISKQYVNSESLFMTSTFLTDFSMKMDSNKSYSKYQIVKNLKDGNPCIMYMKGRWVYNGIVYHSSYSTHFLVIMGYNGNGYYVYDPASKTNTYDRVIPFEAFNVKWFTYPDDPGTKKKEVPEIKINYMSTTYKSFSERTDKFVYNYFTQMQEVLSEMLDPSVAQQKVDSLYTKNGSISPDIMSINALIEEISYDIFGDDDYHEHEEVQLSSEQMKKWNNIRYNLSVSFTDDEWAYASKYFLTDNNGYFIGIIP